MVEIITRGQLPGDKRHSATCTNCLTTFTFFEREARKQNGCLYIACPLNGCSATVTKAVGIPSDGYSYFNR